MQLIHCCFACVFYYFLFAFAWIVSFYPPRQYDDVSCSVTTVHINTIQTPKRAKDKLKRQNSRGSDISSIATQSVKVQQNRQYFLPTKVKARDNHGSALCAIGRDGLETLAMDRKLTPSGRFSPMGQSGSLVKLFIKFLLFNIFDSRKKLSNIFFQLVYKGKWKILAHSMPTIMLLCYFLNYRRKMTPMLVIISIGFDIIF